MHRVPATGNRRPLVRKRGRLDELTVGRRQHHSGRRAGAGAFGGAGASGAWTAEGAGRDDPYFYGSTADRATYDDAEDFSAFDAPASGGDAATGAS